MNPTASLVPASGDPAIRASAAGGAELHPESAELAELATADPVPKSAWRRASLRRPALASQGVEARNAPECARRAGVGTRRRAVRPRTTAVLAMLLEADSLHGRDPQRRRAAHTASEVPPHRDREHPRRGRAGGARALGHRRRDAQGRADHSRLWRAPVRPDQPTGGGRQRPGGRASTSPASCSSTCGSTRPACWTEEGTAAFVDISGFTKLSEQLARKGREGAEQITEVIGDELRVDPGGRLRRRRQPAQVRRGRAPAVVRRRRPRGARLPRSVPMRDVLRDVGRIELPDVEVTLQMSQGVHTGRSTSSPSAVRTPSS